MLRPLGRFLVLGSILLTGARALQTETNFVWPDAPPEVLREEIFGIRFRLILWDQGPRKAAQFLREEIRKRPDAPEVKAYMAWVSLFPKSWEMGELVPREACEPLLSVAARAGSSVAKDVLGYAMVVGSLGIRENREEGLRLLRESAAAGFPRSIGRLGRMQLEGWYVPAQPKEGLLNLARALALGSTTDLADLAESHERGAARGEEVATQQTLALEYYYLLALENDGLGWNKLQEFSKKNVPGAKLLQASAYVRFANEGGFLVPARVKPFVRVLESEGSQDPRACVELGVAKLKGSIAKRDMAGAKELFSRARDAGNDEAKFFLAFMRMRGFAGPEEREPALAEMKALAAAGNVRANARLGYYYYWGGNEAGSLKKDPSLAFHYARHAAELGSRSAALNLAHCYRHGIGTAENPTLAAKMYWIATNYGANGAKEEVLRQLAFIK